MKKSKHKKGIGLPCTSRDIINSNNKNKFSFNILNRYPVPELNDSKESSHEDCQGEDIISGLPNNVLTHMACFLPLESVKCLALLSSRWRHMWMEKVIKFGPMSELPKVVSEYYGPIRGCTSLTHALLLEYHIDKSSRVFTYFVNQRLSLDFRHAVTAPPDYFYMLFLKLKVIEDCPSSHCCLDFSFVRVLNLHHVNYLSKDALASMAQQFHFLEYLKICDGNFYWLSIDLPNLRGLSIFDCPKLECVFIRAPKLQYLLNIGNRPRKYYVWGLDNGLTSVKLDYRRGPKAEPAYFGSFLDDLFFAPFVECLTLCQWDFHINIRPKVHEGVLFSKLKEVWWIDNSMEQWKIESLISFLRLCPVLEKLLITVDPTCYVDNRFQDMQCNVRANKPLSRLKLVKLEGFSSQEEEILLAARIYQEVMGGPVKVVSLRLDVVKVIVRVRSKEADRKAYFKGSKKDRSSIYEYKYFEETDTETVNWVHPHKYRDYVVDRTAAKR